MLKVRCLYCDIKQSIVGAQVEQAAPGIIPGMCHYAERGASSTFFVRIDYPLIRWQYSCVEMLWRRDASEGALC